MKMLLKTLILTGVAVLSVSSAAVARDYPLSTEQERNQRSWEYYNKKNADNRTETSRQVSDNTTSMPKASQYPCAGCVYSSEQGGYIQKHYGKR